MRNIVNSIGLSNQEKSNYQIRLANKDKFDGIVLYPGEKTIMDIIEIDHPDPEAARLIHNFLVDNSKINEMRLVDKYEGTFSASFSLCPLLFSSAPPLLSRLSLSILVSHSLSLSALAFPRFLEGRS